MGGVPDPVDGDPIGLTILDGTAVVTTPTNNIDGNGGIAAVTFKGLAAGLTLTASKIRVDYDVPGFTSAGAATTVAQTATAVAAMRMPVPAAWVTATVYAAGARCVHRGGSTTRIYSTAAGGTSGATPPTHTSGSVSDGGVTWTYLSDCEQNTTNTATQPVELVVGSDVEIYVVLDKRIPSTATNLVVDIDSGAYGTSNASISANCPVTNDSTFAGYKPIVSWVTHPWQLIDGTIRAEVEVTHPFGQSSRMAACVKFTVYDNANAATAVTSTVTSMEQSDILTTTYGNPVPVFGADLNVAGLADGLYSIKAEVFPFVGLEWDSDADGFGSTDTWSISTVMPGNNAKRIPFELDNDNSIPIYYASVDGVGGGTPAVSTVEATAKTTPYASIVAAANALQAATGTTLAHQIIDILGGTTVTAFGATMDSGSSKTYGTGWLTIRKYPGDAGVATINADTVTAANRICGKRTKFYDVTLAGSTSAVIDNAEAATVGLVAHEVWIDNCIVTGNNTQQPVSRAGWLSITNSSLSGTATMTGNSRMAWHRLSGSTFAGAGATSNYCSAVNVTGNKFVTKARLTQPTSRYWNDNSQVVASMQYGFNSWYDCTQNVVWSVTCAATGGTTTALTEGAAWVSNLIESNDAAAKGGEISADGVVTALPMLYDLFNTSAGDGQNIGYNETGSAQVKKTVVAKFNFFPDRNIKRDTYDDATGATNPARTGSYLNGFGCEWLCNIITAATNTTPSASNLSGEVIESRSVLSGTAGFTNDQSKTGGAGGNGNYVPTTSSSAYDQIGATEQMLPFDLNGTARKTDGTGAAGAFEWA